MQYKLDDKGVPIISRAEIEAKADEVIEYFDSSILRQPTFTPLVEFVSKLNTHFNITFEFNTDLGEANGKKILGKFQLKPRVIYIDNSMSDSEPRWHFTLAHELGHLVFHRDLYLNRSRTIPDDTENMVNEEEMDEPSFDWIEWHANKFAASILMPKNTFYEAVCNFQQQQLQLTRSIGKIYLDNQRCNIASYCRIIEHLCGIFRTSKVAVKIRFKELGILLENYSTKRASIIELFRAE
jgi:hypothetical protein